MPTLLMLPPQEAKTREWAARVKSGVPGLEVIVAEDAPAARAAIARADCAFGTLPPDLLAQATRLSWLQAPQAAPPAGYYYPALVQHPVVVTNFREIYNDHIAAHIMAFVLAFARASTAICRSRRAASGSRRRSTRAWCTCPRRRR